MAETKKEKSTEKKVKKTGPSALLKDGRVWYHIDAQDKILGRVASQVALILRGKNKKTYTPHINNGDFVVVTNAEKIKVTTKDKKYFHHTGYMGGIKEISLEVMRAKHPERLISIAVRGMLPPNKLRARFLKALKVYGGPAHPHHAQNPKTLELRHNA